MNDNRIIAEFMGWKQADFNKEYMEPPKGERWEWSAYAMYQLQYHTSWDWLMPVVEKIGKQANVTIRVGICTIEPFYMNKRRIANEKNIPFDEVPPLGEENERDFIGNVYSAVVQFITWYNEQKKD